MPDQDSLGRRVAMHAALAEPHRLAIADMLALSDRSPSDLARELGIGTNLLAHHLLTLERAGLTETVVSAGDRRRRYVRLRQHPPGMRLPAFEEPPRSVLFVCKANSARSQLALALWRQRSDVAGASAGTEPADEVSRGARRAAERLGLDLGKAVPQGLAAIEGQPDLVVTVCDEAHESLDLVGRVSRFHWSIPDPVGDGRPAAFEATVDVLTSRLGVLAQAIAA